MEQRKKNETTHTSARVDAAIHRQLLRLLFEEGRSFRQWLQCQEEQYLKRHDDNHA